MRRPKYQRDSVSASRKLAHRHPAPDFAALDELANRVQYTGSPEHKRTASFAGPPALRSNASICPSELANQRDTVTEWLRTAVRQGMVSERFDGDFPHFVWYQASDGQRYQARLTNRGSGAYKGWPITADEVDEMIFQP